VIYDHPLDLIFFFDVVILKPQINKIGIDVTKVKPQISL